MRIFIAVELVEVRKMHDAGVNHTDLNIHNILLDTTKRVIIDFDKCGHQALVMTGEGTT